MELTKFYESHPKEWAIGPHFQIFPLLPSTSSPTRLIDFEIRGAWNDCFSLSGCSCAASLLTVVTPGGAIPNKLVSINKRKNPESFTRGH